MPLAIPKIAPTHFSFRDAIEKLNPLRLNDAYTTNNTPSSMERNCGFMNVKARAACQMVAVANNKKGQIRLMMVLA